MESLNDLGKVSVQVTDAGDAKTLHTFRVSFLREGKEGYWVGATFPGYAENQADDEHSYPVLLEYRNGVPHVIIFADINDDSPTHVISLAGAHESLRKEKE